MMEIPKLELTESAKRAALIHEYFDEMNLGHGQRLSALLLISARYFDHPDPKQLFQLDPQQRELLDKCCEILSKNIEMITPLLLWLEREVLTAMQEQKTRRIDL